jgi:hypothetical protein
MKKNRITHQQFFEICECLRNHREKVLAECSSNVSVARLVSGLVQFQVPDAAAANALGSIGLVLTKKPAQKPKNNSVRVLASAILKLYIKLGECPPDNLLELVEKINGRAVAKQTATQFAAPIPVKTLTDPKTMSVANVKS